MFNYRKATDEEILLHILTATRQSVSMAKKHYESVNAHDVVLRISEARKKASIMKLENKLKVMKDED